VLQAPPSILAIASCNHSKDRWAELDCVPYWHVFEISRTEIGIRML
jgi:hypothetical protein